MFGGPESVNGGPKTLLPPANMMYTQTKRKSSCERNVTHTNLQCTIIFADFSGTY